MAQPTGRVSLYDGDGNLITTLQLDENGEAQYSFQLDNEDVGRNNLRAVYTGDNDYAARAEDNFVLEVVDENGEGGEKSKSTTVKKIIAGPGIYISPKDGRGDVTISTRPISDAGDEDFYRVRWTQTFSGETKFNTDLSMFVAAGSSGLVMTSDDAQGWTNTGPVNKLGVGGLTVSFDNIHVLQKDDYPGEGLIYFNIQEGTFDDGTPGDPDFISLAWGNLGYTDVNGIYKGDNIDKLSSKLIEVGTSIDISGQRVDYAETFLLGSDLLTLVFSLQGKIWSINQLATDFEVTTDDQLAILRPEATGIGNVRAAWSNKELLGTGSFQIKAVTVTGEILNSNRSGNSQSTWTTEYNGSTQLNAIGFNPDDNTWIAVGSNNTVLIKNAGGGWVSNPPLNGVTWWGVAYGNGKWVLVGARGAIAISTDNAQTWQLSSSGSSVALYDVAYSPTLNMFAAVGEKRFTVAITGF